MFEKFTDAARRVIFFAHYEADNTGAQYLETEHLLLEILRQDTKLGIRYPGELGTVVDAIRNGMEARHSQQKLPTVSTDVPLSHQCKRALAYAAEESTTAHHSHIGTPELLMGLLRDESCEAARILAEYGLKLDDVRLKESNHGED